MELLDLVALVGVALATSILSGILGMAGGIALLSVMLLYFEPLVAVPLHGAVQWVSNGSRTWIQRAHVEWPLVRAYAVLLVPMAILGLFVARELPAPVARALIGIFVLTATWRPSWLRLASGPAKALPERRFLFLGAFIGFLQMTVGATGPLQAPFYLNLGLSRQGIVGTKAAAQALSHVSKIALFGIAGFVFRDHLELLVLMCVAVVVGTWIGSRILHRVNERWFLILYRVVLTIIALRLVVLELYRALA